MSLKDMMKGNASAGVAMPTIILFLSFLSGICIPISLAGLVGSLIRMKKLLMPGGGSTVWPGREKDYMLLQRSATMYFIVLTVAVCWILAIALTP